MTRRTRTIGGRMTTMRKTLTKWRITRFGYFQELENVSNVRIREVVGYMYLTEKERTNITTIYRARHDRYRAREDP